jgi:F-type H+-transporting ATPase subunit epsilon
VAEKFKLAVLSPSKRVFEGAVDTVTVTGIAGEFGVLPGHYAYITSVRPGPLVIVEADGKKSAWFVGHGLAQVSADRVSVVVSEAMPASEVDAVGAKELLGKAEKALMDLAPGDPAHGDAEVDQAMALGRILAAERASA